MKIAVVALLSLAACVPPTGGIPDSFTVEAGGHHASCSLRLTGAYACQWAPGVEPPDHFEFDHGGKRFECEITMLGRYSCSERWRSINQPVAR